MAESLPFENVSRLNGNFSERFETIKNLGRGTTGLVLKVKEINDKRKEYAIKKICLQGDPPDMFLNEVKLLQKLKSKFVIQFFSALFDSEFIYIKMELGHLDLKEFLKVKMDRFGRTLNQSLHLTEYFISLQLFRELTECVNYLHSLRPPILHRDLKPANILICCSNGSYNLKLCDFGFSILHERTIMSHTQGVGTLKYMAPEVIKGRQYNLSADIYSLGVIAKDIFGFEFSSKLIVHCDYPIMKSDMKGEFESLRSLVKTILSDKSELRPNSLFISETLNSFKILKKLYKNVSSEEINFGTDIPGIYMSQLLEIKYSELNTNEEESYVRIGSKTRIDKIQKQISKLFGGRPLNYTNNGEKVEVRNATVSENYKTQYRGKYTRTIGIDLGTTNSCVSYFKPSAENKFNCVIIPNELGENKTASVVSIRDDEEVVGDVAKEEIYAYPKNTIMSAKRLIGRKFNDESVQKCLKLWSYDVFDDGNNKPKIKIQVNNKEKHYYPEQISAKVLKKMRDISEVHFGCEVTKAVITVPAYFNDAQKQATKDAAKIAGLEVLQIINEPTAAAIAYRLNITNDTTPRNVLIYDFGAGNFDVAVLTISQGEIDVKAVGGDNHLGGDDFDTNIIKYCLEEFSRKYNTRLDFDYGMRSMSRLRLEAEKSKMKLSAVRKTKLQLMYFYESHDLNVVLTRDIFEHLNKELIDKSMQLVLSTLKDAALTTNDIDDIVLVGGTTKIPKIQEELSKTFGGVSLNDAINPEEAVAVGAAIRAAMLIG